jgi:deoxyhypusine synthase
MGKWLMTNGKKENSLVKLAYEHDVPIFCPAFTDSSAGFGLVKHQVDRMKEGKPYLTMDSIADFPRADRHQDRGRRHRPADDRRRRAEELRPGYGGLRRDPGQGSRRAQIRDPDHGGGRARRRLLVLDAAGSGELGQGLDRDGADGVRRGDQRGAAAGLDAYHRGHWRERAKRRFAKLFHQD